MPFDLPEPTEWAVPIFVVLVIAEILYAWKTGKVTYEGKDAYTSLIMGLGSSIAGVVFGTFVFLMAYWFWENFRLIDDVGFGIHIFVVAFVLQDLAYYWVHRCGHRVRWMWAAHVVHHSSQHYNLTTALRQTWTGQLTPGIFFYWPILFLGIHPAIVVFCSGLNLLYQFWFHTEAIDKCPRWFEAIMNTPSHHRVHHANNPRYLDANYAGVFIVWDKFFGTFVPENKEEPCNYGLVTDLDTFNPLRVATHEWVGIFSDMWSAKSWKHKLLFLLAPPGWTPDGSRMTSEMLRDAWLERQKSVKTPAE